MEKLNAVGKKLIDYKHEYIKNTSQVVRDALSTSLDVMIQQGIIDKEIKEQIASENDDSNLIHLLERNPKFKKSPRELYKEFEKIRTILESSLKDIGIQGYFETESSVEFNRLTVLRQYSLDKDFILDYFGIQEIDLIQLMKKRGFAEKFAVLRMNLIFDEILQEIRPEENILQAHSLVYYNPDITGFSIDYKYHVNVDIVEDENTRANIVRRIAEIDRNVDNKFKTKMGIKYYTQKRLKKQSVIAEPIKKPEEPKKEIPKAIENKQDTPIIPIKQNKDNSNILPQKKEPDKIKTPDFEELTFDSKKVADKTIVPPKKDNVKPPDKSQEKKEEKVITSKTQGPSPNTSIKTETKKDVVDDFDFE